MVCNDLQNFWKTSECQKIVFGLLVFALGVSVVINIYYCASKHCSGKRTRKEYKRSRTQRQMEENPIYGNVTLQSAQTVTETSFTSYVRRDQRRIDAISQDCYANLSLQRAPVNNRPSSPASPADLDHDLDHDLDSEKDPEDAEVRSALSELYASVQTKAKILKSPDSAEEYANHL